jgi:hypothetical protein
MSCERIESLERVMGSSLEYILSRQRRDGSWGDWALPPGESSIWTTAFVGCRLRSLPVEQRERAWVSTGLAATWLEERIFSDGGWGYNEEVGSDADSTALAILFLASQGESVSEDSYECLLSFQGADGGFATYRRSMDLGSWGVSHTDVTPTAVLAMMTKYDVESTAVDRGLQFVLNHKTAGVWQPFWWTSFLYSTEVSLSLLKEVGLHIDLRWTRETLLKATAQHAFESALLVSSLLLMPDVSLDQEIWPLVAALIEDQASDGSWRSGPMLRVTRRDCLEAWKPGDPDRLFSDQNHLFTTATVLDALSKVYLSLKQTSGAAEEMCL